MTESETPPLPASGPGASQPPAWEARRLLRAARVGTLATQSAGQPAAGLVTPAMAGDGALLLLLSDLSEHTRHLRADPRCALMVVGAAPEPNPQTAPRVTVSGAAVIDDGAAARARFLAVHPYAALYADFGDFHLWRLVPEAAQFVGGFARAFRLPAATLAPDPDAVAALAASAEEIMAHCNADHADTMALLAGGSGAWSMAGVDVDGCDLARQDVAAGEAVRRVAWEAPVADANGVRAALIRLARVERQAARPSSPPG